MDWAFAAQFSIVGLFVLALLVSLSLGQAVLMPVALAWVLATVLLPIVRWLEERGVPHAVAVIGVTIAVIVLAVVLIGLLSTPVAYWLGRASELGTLIKAKLQSLSSPIGAIEEIGKAVKQLTGDASPGVKVESSSMVGTILGVLTPVLSQTLVCIGTLLFYMLSHEELKKATVMLAQSRETRLAILRILHDIDGSMSVYFGTFTLINTALGFVTVGLAWVAGLPNPLLWGVLAAVLNFIPYFGVAIVVATLAVVGFLTFPTLTQAVIAPAAYIGITTLEGHFITPALLGHRLTLNPLAVFLAIAFWTWMWGPIGAFLAVPLLITIAVVARHMREDDSAPLPG